MRRRLRSVRIQRFKCIGDALIDVGDVNVIVGANNSGKSSVIQALHFAVGALQTMRLGGRFPEGAKGNTISTSLNPDQLIYSPSKNVVALGPGGRLFENEGEAVRIALSLDDGNECTVTVRKGKNRNILVASDNRAIAYELGSLEEPFSVFSPGLAGIAKDEHYVSDGVLLRTIARGDANLVLRNTLYRLWGTTKWDEFLGDLSHIFPGIAFHIDFRRETDEYITAEVTRSGESVPLELAGTGVLQATQILSYIHQFGPALVVLDEPDSHLHPNNQRLLCTLLQRVAQERQTQIVLTTHSRHVVDALAETARFFWVRNGTVDAATPDDEIGILLDIGALDIKERAAQPNARVVVLTEDAIVRPLQALLDSAGFNESQTAILPYFGCTNPAQLRPLVRMIRGTNPKAAILVHRDRDYLLDDEAEEWMKRARRLGTEPFLTFLTETVDMEGHFLSAKHLAKLNPGGDAAAFQKLLDAAREEAHTVCVEKYVNGRIDILRKRGEAGSINPGRLASEAPEKIKGDPQKFTHGKAVLAALRRRYRKDQGHELRVFEPSEHLLLGGLLLAAKKIGPKRGSAA